MNLVWSRGRCFQFLDGFLNIVVGEHVEICSLIEIVVSVVGDSFFELGGGRGWWTEYCLVEGGQVFESCFGVLGKVTCGRDDREGGRWCRAKETKDCLGI